jgi:hypothetical protein
MKLPNTEIMMMAAAAMTLALAARPEAALGNGSGAEVTWGALASAL